MHVECKILQYAREFYFLFLATSGRVLEAGRWGAKMMEEAPGESFVMQSQPARHHRKMKGN
jgi:hypothetical protein